MILRDFFSSLMTVSLSSSFSPSPSASVISARRAAARSSAGGVGCKGDNRDKTQHWYFRKEFQVQMKPQSKSRIALHLPAPCRHLPHPPSSLPHVTPTRQSPPPARGSSSRTTGDDRAAQMPHLCPRPLPQLKPTLVCGLSASYSPSCMAVAILFMVAMRMLQD